MDIFFYNKVIVHYLATLGHSVTGDHRYRRWASKHWYSVKGTFALSIERRNRVVKQALQLRPMLVTYAYGLLRDHARAEDVVHDAYLVVMDKYDDFEDGTSMIAWCRTIVRFKVSETIRKERRMMPVEERILYDAVDNAFQMTQREVDSVHNSASSEALEHCLTRMKETHRVLISACYKEQLTYEELATRFDLNVETVRKRLYRIRTSLRDCTNKQRRSIEAQS